MESAVNQLIENRMSKSQQMRWLADEVFPNVPLRAGNQLDQSTRCAHEAGPPFPLRFLFAAHPQAG